MTTSPARSDIRNRLGRLLEGALWWGLCLSVWLISLSAVPGQELVVATLASLPCGVLAVMGRRAASSRWSLQIRWLGPVLVIPAAIVSDTIQVLSRGLIGRARGERRDLPLPGGEGDSAHAAGRRALATVLICATPRTFVTDVDPEGGRLTVHEMPGGGPQMDRVVTR